MKNVIKGKDLKNGEKDKTIKVPILFLYCLVENKGLNTRFSNIY